MWFLIILYAENFLILFYFEGDQYIVATPLLL